MKVIRKSTKLPQLKRSYENAQIMRSGMKLVLMMPSLDSRRRSAYKETFSKLNDEIRELKIIMDNMGQGIAGKHTDVRYKRK